MVSQAFANSKDTFLAEKNHGSIGLMTKIGLFNVSPSTTDLTVPNMQNQLSISYL